jgi:DNA-binding response OmpR family regulator
VDDDPLIAEVLAPLLVTEGYGVHAAATGREAMTQFRTAAPGLVLLDLELPDVHGLVLCSHLRERSDVPIMLMSGTTERWQETVGLRLGADDFVAKPFDSTELLARVAALMRRRGSALLRSTAPTRATEPSTLQLGSLVVDRIQRRATTGERSVRLSPVEHRLLVTLIAKADQVVRRAELAALVWDDPVGAGGRTIDTHVTRLRTKLATLSGPVPRIVCERNVGYVITEPASDDVAPTLVAA